MTNISVANENCLVNVDQSKYIIANTTPGQWISYNHWMWGNSVYIVAQYLGEENGQALVHVVAHAFKKHDADFICYARNNMDKMVDEIKNLRAEIESR